MNVEKYTLCLGGPRHFEVELLVNTFAFAGKIIISRDAAVWA